MTKYSIEALADALRPEVKTFGIDVVNVLPSPFISRYFEKAIIGIPWGNQGGPYEIYKDNIRRYLQSFMANGAFRAMSAEHVAEVVLKAATTEHPRTRYYVGALSRLAPIARSVAPDRLVDAYMRWRIPES